MASSLLDDAEAALASGDGARCGALAQEALQGGGLAVADTARAWSLRARCYVRAGDLERAERAYAVLLRVAPPPPPGPADDVALVAARRALPTTPALALRAAGTGEGDTIELELLGDDLLLARGARLVRGDEELARVPLEAGHARHRVSGATPEVTGVTAELLDKYGNALVQVPVAAREIVVTPGPAAVGRGPTWLTTLGATAIGAGIVGVVTSGIGLASLGPAGLNERGDDGALWLVGVGASTGVFLVGASLVVVDQGLGG